MGADHGDESRGTRVNRRVQQRFVHTTVKTAGLTARLAIRARIIARRRGRKSGALLARRLHRGGLKAAECAPPMPAEPFRRAIA